MSTTPVRATARPSGAFAAWPLAAPGWRALAGHAGLGALVGGALTIALGAASNDLIVDTASADEPGWLGGALSGVVPGLSGTAFSVALLAMLAGYAVLVWLWDAVSPHLALGALGLGALALMLAPPLLSSDLFGYIGYGRLGALHGLNPYRHGVIAAPHDPALPLIYWQHPTSPYGPLFTLGTYAIAPRSLPVEAWTLKALGGLAWAASVGLVWRAAALIEGPPARPALRAALVLGANPLLLVYGVGGGHNDLIVMALVTGALALAAARRGAATGAALVAAVGVKVTGGLLLPFALAGSRLRGRVAAGAAAAGAALVALTLAAFGVHVFDTIGSIASGSPAFRIDYSGPDLAGRLLGTGVSAGVRAGGAVLVLAVVALGLRAIARGADWLTAAGAAVLALLCSIAALVPWYVAWVLPMAALSRSRALRAGVLVFTAAVVATHLPLLGFAPYE